RVISPTDNVTKNFLWFLGIGLDGRQQRNLILIEQCSQYFEKLPRRFLIFNDNCLRLTEVDEYLLALGAELVSLTFLYGPDRFGVLKHRVQAKIQVCSGLGDTKMPAGLGHSLASFGESLAKSLSHVVQPWCQPIYETLH